MITIKNSKKNIKLNSKYGVKNYLVQNFVFRMKSRLAFFISTISGFLSPDVLTGPSPLKVFSLDELVDFGGCYPHEGPMTVSDAKSAYSADHVTIGSLKSISNGDYMAVISPLSSSGSEGMV